METLQRQVETDLRLLVGHRLTCTHRAADMRIFHLGEMQPVRDGWAGEFGLHVQCPWRIEGPYGIVTGRSDLWKPASTENADQPGFDWDAWNYERGQNLQDERIAQLLEVYSSAIGRP